MDVFNGARDYLFLPLIFDCISNFFSTFWKFFLTFCLRSGEIRAAGAAFPQRPECVVFASLGARTIASVGCKGHWWGTSKNAMGTSSGGARVKADTEVLRCFTLFDFHLLA